MVQQMLENILKRAKSVCGAGEVLRNKGLI
jgi:hypothetical protein